MIDGASVSLTVTVKEQLVLLPLASVTVKVFVVVPTGKTAPLARPAVCTVVDPLQLSVPTGEVYVTVAPHTPASLLLTIGEGQVIDGASVSLTFTVKEQLVLLPLASVTVKVLVVVPTGKVAPLARPAVCVVVEPEQLSVPTGAV